jgi:hypothetical protein
MAEVKFELDEIENADVKKHQEDVETTISAEDITNGPAGRLFALYVETNGGIAETIFSKLAQREKLSKDENEELYGKIIPDLQEVIGETTKVREALTSSESGKMDILSMIGAASPEFARIAKGSKSSQDLAEGIARELEALAIIDKNTFNEIKKNIATLEKREKGRQEMKSELVGLCEEYGVPAQEVTTALQLREVVEAMIDGKKGYGVSQVRQKLVDINVHEDDLEEFDKLTKGDLNRNKSRLKILANTIREKVVKHTLEENEKDWPTMQKGMLWWKRTEKDTSTAAKQTMKTKIDDKFDELVDASERYKAEVGERKKELGRFGKFLYGSLLDNEVLSKVLTPGEKGEDTVESHISVSEAQKMFLTERDKGGLRDKWLKHIDEVQEDYDDLNINDPDDLRKINACEESFRQKVKTEKMGKKGKKDKSFVAKMVEIFLDKQIDDEIIKL